ncbi:MAG TPA: YkgJ family cysteine cluster protein [Solirubrobacterales bacterium]|nr:YkgJ family cysteine cluster protein [Solirubrobacterales bacterium]
MSTEASNGCSGLCCAAFRIPETRASLRAAGKHGDEERAQIAEMVIPLTPKEANERNAALGGDAPYRWARDRGRVFTCKHWDEETRLCGIYEDRPDMCRKFPYDKPCCFGCSCKGTPIDDA